MTTDNTEAKQAAMVALQKINAVEGFDPSALAVEYTDLNSAGGKETRLRLPVMAQIGWFRLKYPEGRIAVSVTTGKDCFVATARVYPHYSAPVDQFLAEAKCLTAPLGVVRHFDKMEELWADHGQMFGERGERHERPFGKASLHLDKQVHGPHRVNGYVKYMAQPYGQTRATIPPRKEDQGEPDAAYKQAVAA